MLGGAAVLILTRKIGESLVIGDDVVVTLLSIKGNQVRLGIKAPQNISVHREEIYQRICDTLKQFEVEDVVVEEKIAS